MGLRIISETFKQSNNAQTIASLTCSSGLKINIYSMIISDGCWDAAVRTIGPKEIRLQNMKILDVMVSEAIT